MANTGKSANRDSFQSLGKRIQYGLNTASPFRSEMGAIMGFMDMPYRTRPGWSHGNMGGPWQTIWPGGDDPRMNGGNGGGNCAIAGQHHNPAIGAAFAQGFDDIEAASLVRPRKVLVR